MVLVAYITVITALLYFALRFCLNYLLPFVIGTVIAVLIQKPAFVLSKRIRLSHGTVALILVVSVYLVLVLLLTLVGSRVYFSAAEIYSKMPQYIEKISSAAEGISKKAQEFFSGLPGNYGQYMANAVQNSVSHLAERIAEYISAFIASIVTGMPGFVFSLVVTVISGCYIAKDFDSFKKILSYALKEEHLKVINTIKRITVNNVLKIAKGYIILSVFAFLELFAGFLILGVNGAARIALITAFVDLLPVFGSGTVLLPWAVVSIIKGDTVLFLGLIVLYITVTVIRNILEPKIMGKQVGLHPLLTLFSLFLGLKLFGVAGMFLLPLIVTVAYKYAEEKVTAQSLRHSM